jgi:hypothetical protein
MARWHTSGFSAYLVFTTQIKCLVYTFLVSAYSSGFEQGLADRAIQLIPLVLQATLPLNFSSSVFVRVDEGNLALWRVMITGPADTPCAPLAALPCTFSTAFGML